VSNDTSNKKPSEAGLNIGLSLNDTASQLDEHIIHNPFNENLRYKEKYMSHHTVFSFLTSVLISWSFIVMKQLTPHS
jgi:hypothetical protein